jgi:hypothetical protein
MICLLPNVALEPLSPALGAGLGRVQTACSIVFSLFMLNVVAKDVEGCPSKDEIE